MPVLIKPHARAQKSMCDVHENNILGAALLHLLCYQWSILTKLPNGTEGLNVMSMYLVVPSNPS